MEALDQETQPIELAPTKLTELMKPSSYGCGVLVTGEDHEVQMHCSTEEPHEPLSVALWQRENCGCCSTRTSLAKTRGNEDCAECVLVPEATCGNHSYCSRCGRAVVAVQMSWEADRSWSLRMLTLLLQCARLRMLMAWCSTLGGAHSSLGEEFITHAKKAGEISHKQLALASEMGDPRLASQCKLYAAFSLLQRGRLNQAAKIIRYVTWEGLPPSNHYWSFCHVQGGEQYRFARSEATVVDQKFPVEYIPYILLSVDLMQLCGNTWAGQLGDLASAASIVVRASVINVISMCLSAWIRLQHLRQAKKTASPKDVEIQEVS